MPYQIDRFTDWLARERGLRFDAHDSAGYHRLWRWSVDELPAFWDAVWHFYDLQSPTPVTAVLADAAMPGARWFEGAQVNYAQQVFRHADGATHPAIVYQDEAMAERGEVGEIGWAELRRQVASLAARLKDLGVQRGDRVCAILPNRPQAAVAFLAVASLGAVWSVCSPDMGPVAVLDRFRQIAPKVLIAGDAYRHGGVVHDRLPLLRQLLAELPSVQQVVLWRHPEASGPRPTPAGTTSTRSPRAMRRWSRPGCRSTIRCGSSTPAAPPACPRPSCTAMAA